MTASMLFLSFPFLLLLPLPPPPPTPPVPSGLVDLAYGKLPDTIAFLEPAIRRFADVIKAGIGHPNELRPNLTHFLLAAILLALLMKRF